MPIQIGAKGASLFGQAYPPYAYIDWFTPDQEAQATQGGDALVVPSRSLTPAEVASLKSVVSQDGTYTGSAPQRTIDNFSTSGAWTSAGAGVPVLSVGSYAAYGNTMAVTTDGTTNNHDIVRPFACRMDRGEAIAFAFKPDPNISLVNITVSLGDSTFTKTAVLIDDSVPGSGGGGRPDYFAGQWKTIAASGQRVVAYAGGATLADLKDVRAIRIRTKTGTAVAGVATFAQLRYVADRAGKRVIWQFDDGRNNTFDAAFPILAAAGYTGTLAVPPADLGQTLAVYNNVPIITAAQVAQLYAAGWELIGHHGTSFSGMSASQVQACLDLWHAFCAANGYTRGRSHWAYAGGWFDTASAAIVARNGFVSARRVSGTSQPYTTNVRRVFEPTQCGSVYLTQSYALATAKARLDAVAALGNGVVIFTNHNVVPSYTAEAEDWTTADYAALVAYARQLGFVGSTFDVEFGTLYEG